MKKSKLLKIRRPDLSYSNSIPRDWAQGDLVLSHMYNIFNLILPETEKTFVKSIGSVLPYLDNDHLKILAIGYIGQEAQHAKQHKKAQNVMKAQGYKIEPIIKVLSLIGFTLPSKLFGKKFAVSLAGAFEHVTILVAKNIFSKNLLDGSNEEMRSLFEWHVAEEVEHRNAVHDIITYFCPSYFWKFFAIFLASGILFMQSYIGTMLLLIQDGKFFSIKNQFSYFKHYGAYYPGPIEMIIDYLKPGYHPDQYMTSAIIEKANLALKFQISKSQPSRNDVKKKTI